MSVDIIRLLIDFGFVVLIWAVQLVIYPSFSFYKRTDLVTWHRIYTKKVTLVVLPLMVSQLLLGLYQVYLELNWYTILGMCMILSLWLLTFMVFVPLHMRIDNNEFTQEVCHKLVQKNWIRTVLWNLLFIMSLIHIILL